MNNQEGGTVPIVPFHPYQRDSRAARMVNYKIKPKATPTHASGEVLLICASPEIEAQLVAVAGTGASKRELNESAALKYTAGFHFPDGVPQCVVSLLEVLQAHLTLNARAGVNVAMSLDWHKKDDGSGELVNTEAGRWVQYTKYAPYPKGSGSRKAWREMVEALEQFIRHHPIYAHATTITAPPGHLADGNSWGERLAHAVAVAVGKPYVAMTAKGPRAELKSGETGQIDLTGEFAVTQRLHGRVLIIDDVYHTGATMDAASMACREAGATEVLVLTTTRTLKR
ncbi:ComF family protein [Curtobacterium sp. NPDC089991]|uniref:ComF family protein n=1 Tax=Curtobacterium sp. NPDC089991 TaxID=3363969 RepID=UPI00382B4A87